MPDLALAVVVAAALAPARPLLPWSEVAPSLDHVSLRDSFNFEGQLLCTSIVIQIGRVLTNAENCAILIPWFQYNSLLQMLRFHVVTSSKANILFCWFVILSFLWWLDVSNLLRQKCACS